MNMDIHKNIANCTLCKKKKAKMPMYPLQMMDIPDQPFDKTVIDLVTDLNVSTSGNQHILTTIEHLIGWLEAFPIPDKKMDLCLNLHQQLSPYTHVAQIYTVW